MVGVGGVGGVGGEERQQLEMKQNKDKKKLKGIGTSITTSTNNYTRPAAARRVFQGAF